MALNWKKDVLLSGKVENSTSRSWCNSYRTSWLSRRFISRLHYMNILHLLFVHFHWILQTKTLNYHIHNLCVVKASVIFRMSESLKQFDINFKIDLSVAKQWNDTTSKKKQLQDFYKIVDDLKIDLLITIHSDVESITRSNCITCLKWVSWKNDVIWYVYEYKTCNYSWKSKMYASWKIFKDVL